MVISFEKTGSSHSICKVHADIGYDGALAFETFRVLEVTPKELWNSSLRHIAEIGKYFKTRIETPREG